MTATTRGQRRATERGGGRRMIGATFCSGIGAPEAAAPWVDWRLASEIEPFPRAVLQERFGYRLPEVHNQGEPLLWGDMTEVTPELLRSRGIPLPDLIVAGTPCQAFSVAGARKGLADARGNLTLAFVEICHAIVAARPDGKLAILWENVPGVLSDKGNAFGCFLGGLVGAVDALPPPADGSWPGEGMVQGPRARAAWSVLDAQWFGVAQRRRRVFVVVDFGNCVDPAAVLLEPDRLRGDSPPRREAGQGAAPTLSARTKGGGGLGTDFDCDGGLIASTDGTHPTLRSMGHSASHQNAGGHAAVAFQERGRSDGRSLEWQNEVAYALTSPNGGGRAQERNIATPWAVRRLTPTETLRLQGFSDTHTAITYRGKPAADGPQYRAHGNSMAVPVIRWIMDRMRLSMEGMA